MPVFINEVVFRGTLQELRKPAVSDATPAMGDPAWRNALVEETARSVIDFLEREIDRVGER